MATAKNGDALANARKQHRFFEQFEEENRFAQGWYYRAREGFFGPFASMEAAESDLARLIYTSPKKRDKYLK